MGFLDNLKKNNFKSISERAISNLQNKDNQNTEKKVEKVSTTETSGITKQSDLSKAGLANTAMGQNESNTHKKNYFNDTFINPNKKILGENVDTLFKNAKSNTKEILESIILQEGLTDLIRNNAGKIATAGVLGAGVAAGRGGSPAFCLFSVADRKPRRLAPFADAVRGQPVDRRADHPLPVAAR